MFSHFKLVSIALLLVIFPIALTSITNAQGIPGIGSGIVLTSSVSNPKPGQDITITARSYNIEIDAAKLTWTVNGVVKQSAIGVTTLSLTAPDLGKKLNIVVTATTPTGGSTSGSITIESGSVDMIMETDGYVPPFFLGKIPPAYQNTVKVIAIPHIADSTGKEYDPKTLVYQWKKNGSVLQDISGYGKQSISIKGDLVPRPYDLNVTASTRNGSGQSAGTISITPQTPTISFYVNDPLYGTLFNLMVGDQVNIGSQKETGVLAVPFGFNIYPNKNNLSLTWLINNMSHPELTTNRSITLRAPTDAGGSSNIQLEIKNSTDMLQGASNGFTATFSADTTANQNNPINY